MKKIRISVALLLVVVFALAFVGCNKVNEKNWAEQLSYDNLTSLVNYTVFSYSRPFIRKVIVNGNMMHYRQTIEGNDINNDDLCAMGWTKINEDGAYSYEAGVLFLGAGEERYYKSWFVPGCTAQHFGTIDGGFANIDPVTESVLLGSGCLREFEQICKQLVEDFDKCKYDNKNKCYVYDYMGRMAGYDTEKQEVILRKSEEYRVYFKNNKLYKLEVYGLTLPVEDVEKYDTLKLQLTVGEAESITIPDYDFGEPITCNVPLD